MKRLLVEFPSLDELKQMGLGMQVDEVEVEDRGLSEAEKVQRSETARSAFELKLRRAAVGGEDVEWPPKWLRVYSMLREAGWKWRVAVYIAWASAPKLRRWPSSQEKLAKEVLGLTSDRTIWIWRQKNAAIDEMVAMLQSIEMMEHRADVFKALAENASKADYKTHADRKLFLEMTGDYVPRSKVEVDRKDVEDLSGLSDEELDELARHVQKAKDHGED